MTEPTRIRAQAGPAGTVVRMLFGHDMESGQRKDSAGALVPAWFIQQVVVSHNGAEVLRCHWGPAVAKNPYLQFTLMAAKPGDSVSVAWRDNRGEGRSDTTVVS
jgi:sulfur-oxidizing protein SoxZ